MVSKETLSTKHASKYNDLFPNKKHVKLCSICSFGDHVLFQTCGPSRAPSAWYGCAGRQAPNRSSGWLFVPCGVLKEKKKCSSTAVLRLCVASNLLTSNVLIVNAYWRSCLAAQESSTFILFFFRFICMFCTAKSHVFYTKIRKK